MVVFWRGYGFVAVLAAVVPAVVLFAVGYLRPQPAALPVGAAFAAAAVACEAAGRKLRWVPGPHTLYGLPLRVWAVAYAGLAGWLLVTAFRR